jgi:hypothetical protein
LPAEIDPAEAAWAARRGSGWGRRLDPLLSIYSAFSAAIKRWFMSVCYGMAMAGDAVRKMMGRRDR